jgi:hypothetical protein
LIGPDDIAGVFRVELPGELGGVGQVADHHGELAAFSLGDAAGGFWDDDWRARQGF